MYLVHRASNPSLNPNGHKNFFVARFVHHQFQCKIDRYLLDIPTHEERGKKDIIGHIIITKQQIKNN